MLRRNILPPRGLVNGALGEVVAVVFEPTKGAALLPSSKGHRVPDAVLVQFDEYDGPSCDPSRPNVVPIFPCTVTTDKGASRRMIPLELGWAISAHKAQGMTVPFATFDLGSYELDAGVTFVASSRARCANNVALKCEEIKNYAYDRWELLRTPGYRKNLASKFERRVRFQAKLNELEEDTLASWLTNHAHAATFRKWLAEDPPPPTFLPAEAPGANL